MKSTSDDFISKRLKSFLKCRPPTYPMDYAQQSLTFREQHGSPLKITSDIQLNSQQDLATHYSPGIAAPCQVIAEDLEHAKSLTFQKNSVAVISDGSAVLGLGDLPAPAALPVMEGKALLFKQFGGVDAVPLVLGTKNSAEIITTIKHLAPSFGGINLEDIAAPRCFEIEATLRKELSIPVFHDDQDGTAMVVAAGLKNALQVVQKDWEKVRVVIAGAGAGGLAIARLLKHNGIQDIWVLDSQGILTTDRSDLNVYKKAWARDFPRKNDQTLAAALEGADVFIGVSKSNTLSPDWIQRMNPQPIIMALANPNPEILPKAAKAAGAAVVATGRSDYPNQINNLLIFPGLFRGLLDAQQAQITDQIKTTAWQSLAALIEQPTADCIIPSPFDPRVAPTIRQAVLDSAGV